MKKIKNILILAGGDSTRFWPLKNKALFKFLGKPLIQYQIETYKKLAENICLVANNETLKQIEHLRLKAKVIAQKKPNGMAGAVLSAKNGLSGETLIVNASDIFGVDSVHQCIDTMMALSPELCLVFKVIKEYFPGGYFKFLGERPLEIVEKPKPEEVPSNKTRPVFDYFKNIEKFIQSIEAVTTNKDNVYEQALNNLLKQNIKARVVEYKGDWQALKYPWHVLPMLQFFLKTLKNEVKIGKNVKIAATAKVVGPCFIDDNTIIGDFTMVRHSQIGKNCVIGGYSEITRSYLGDNVSLHRNYVGDSVLDDHVHMGAEATTANFRFDGKFVKSAVGGAKLDTNLTKLGTVVGAHSKIGVNTTLLPGVKIGSNTFIAPGYTIAEDVEDNMFIFHKKKVRNKS